MTRAHDPQVSATVRFSSVRLYGLLVGRGKSLQPLLRALTTAHALGAISALSPRAPGGAFSIREVTV